jgi:hypothetical protein
VEPAGKTFAELLTTPLAPGHKLGEGVPLFRRSRRRNRAARSLRNSSARLLGAVHSLSHVLRGEGRERGKVREESSARRSRESLAPPQPSPQSTGRGSTSWTPPPGIGTFPYQGVLH